METEGFGGGREYQNDNGKSEDDGDGDAEYGEPASIRNESPHQSGSRILSKNAAASRAGGDDEQQEDRAVR
jgi:hypothetical protein